MPGEKDGNRWKKGILFAVEVHCREDVFLVENIDRESVDEYNDDQGENTTNSGGL